MRFIHGHNRRKYHATPEALVCRLCQATKPAAEFYIDRSRPTGLSSACRECLKARVRVKYAENPEPYLAQAKQWRSDNRQRTRELSKAGRYRRRARLKNVIVERIDPAEIYKRDNWRCHICGKRVAQKDATLDHLIPIAKGGGHTRLNVRLAHGHCNVKRGVDRIAAQLLLH